MWHTGFLEVRTGCEWSGRVTEGRRRLFELSGGSGGQWLVQRHGSPRGNQDVMSCWQCPFPICASLLLCLHPQSPRSCPTFGTILPVTSLSHPTTVKPTRTCPFWVSHFFRAQLQIHYDQKWWLKHLTTNQNDASYRAEVRFGGSPRHKFECSCFWIVERPKDSQGRAAQLQWQGHQPNGSSLALLEQTAAVNNQFTHPGTYQLIINYAKNKNNWKEDYIFIS